MQRKEGGIMIEPTLKNYIERYRVSKELLKAHPENKDLLERKIKEAERDIVAYVTTDDFIEKLESLNL